MAEIVLGLGLPHTVIYPAVVASQGPDNPIARKYAHARTALEHSGADSILIFVCDHINAFFFDRWPTFCVPVAGSFGGPVDEVEALEWWRSTMDIELAGHLHDWLVTHDFDVMFAGQIDVDHGVSIPLHLIDPEHRLPVALVLLNGFHHPLPSAGRCHELGAEVARALAAVPGDRRVALLASGSFSLEVGGPLVLPGLPYGIPDPEWAATVSRHLVDGQVSRVVQAFDATRRAGAGNASGELLPWLTMLGALGDAVPEWLEHEAGEGHSFAAWKRWQVAR